MNDFTAGMQWAERRHAEARATQEWERERADEDRQNVNLCGMFLWMAFSAVIGTACTVLAAPTLGMVRMEAAATVVIWMFVPFAIRILDELAISSLAERIMRRD